MPVNSEVRATTNTELTPTNSIWRKNSRSRQGGRTIQAQASSSRSIIRPVSRATSMLQRPSP